MTATGCQAWREDENGDAIQTEGVCDRPAEWLSCQPFVGARTCTEHKCRCAKPIATSPNVSAESGRPWTVREMEMHRTIAKNYPVEASLRGLPGDHVRRWVATVDALQARIAELKDSIRLDWAERDLAMSVGRNAEARGISEEIRARRGQDWNGHALVLDDPEPDGTGGGQAS